MLAPNGIYNIDYILMYKFWKIQHDNNYCSSFHKKKNVDLQKKTMPNKVRIKLMKFENNNKQQQQQREQMNTRLRTVRT